MQLEGESRAGVLAHRHRDGRECAERGRGHFLLHHNSDISYLELKLTGKNDGLNGDVVRKQY